VDSRRRYCSGEQLPVLPPAILTDASLEMTHAIPRSSVAIIQCQKSLPTMWWCGGTIPHMVMVALGDGASVSDGMRRRGRGPCFIARGTRISKTRSRRQVRNPLWCAVDHAVTAESVERSTEQGIRECGATVHPRGLLAVAERGNGRVDDGIGFRPDFLPPLRNSAENDECTVEERLRREGPAEKISPLHARLR
jgi:hypothetical protein